MFPRFVARLAKPQDVVCRCRERRGRQTPHLFIVALPQWSVCDTPLPSRVCQKCIDLNCIPPLIFPRRNIGQAWSKNTARLVAGISFSPFEMREIREKEREREISKWTITVRLTVSRRGNVIFFLGERRGSDVRGSRDGEDDCSGLGIWKRDCNWRDMFSLSCSDVLLSAGFLIYFVGVRDVAREKEMENVAVKVEK